MTSALPAATRRLLLVLFIGVLMAALDIAIVGPALPAIRSQFAVDDRAAAWVFSIYVLFNLVSTPLMARLSDRFGRRIIYVLDVALFAVGSLMVALAPSFVMLLVGRAIQGFGGGGLLPVASAVIGDTFPPERRGRALGLIGAVFGVAFLIGPLLGGLLLLIGWQWLFLINLPIAALVIVQALRLLPATVPAQQQRFDWPGTLLLSALLASLAYVLNQIDTSQIAASLLSPAVWPFLALTLVLLPLFWLAERRAEAPVLRMGLLRSRQVTLAALLSAGAGLSEAAIVFVPALVVATFAVSESTASFMLVPVVIAMALGAPLSGRILDHVGSRVVVVAGSALITVGMLLVSLFAASLPLFYTAGLLAGLGLAMLLGASLRYIMLNETSTAERGAAQGLLAIATRVGMLLGGTLSGAIADSQGGGIAGYSAIFLVIGLLMLLLTLAALGLKSRSAELETMRRNEAGIARHPAHL